MARGRQVSGGEESVVPFLALSLYLTKKVVECGVVKQTRFGLENNYLFSFLSFGDNPPLSCYIRKKSQALKSGGSWLSPSLLTLANYIIPLSLIYKTILTKMHLKPGWLVS